MHLLMGHDHGDDFKCEAEGNERHYHDTIHQWDTCIFCQLNLSPLEEAETQIQSFKLDAFLSVSNFFATSCFSDVATPHPSLRGPPLYS